ncbi:hypothetical protein C8J57DRAFT_1718750 [Mycena rebaudengoi]|nr:hypothetical protein C8J57DRAFT_1718750 [Mycena rebaudengoi]
MPFPATFDAFVPANPTEFFALAKIQPNYIPFDALKAIQLEDAHKASYEYANKMLANTGFFHCVRTYYFALTILHNGFPSGTPGVPQITFEELNKRLYHACILHDLGWTAEPEGMAHPAHAMSFEIFGGIMAYDHLHATDPKLDANQVGDIVQSIMLHTSEYAAGPSSAVGMLLPLGALFDVMGYDALGPGSLDFLYNRKTVQEIERAYPRGAFAADGAEVLNKEFDTKPNCILSHYRGGREFIGKIRAEPLVPADEVNK